MSPKPSHQGRVGPGEKGTTERRNTEDRERPPGWGARTRNTSQRAPPDGQRKRTPRLKVQKGTERHNTEWS